MVAPIIRRPQLVTVAPRRLSAPPEKQGLGALGHMLRNLNVAQWIVLLYPLFLFIIARKRDEGDVAVVDTSAMLQIGLTSVVGLWVLHRLFNAMRAFEQMIGHTPLRWMLAYAVFSAFSAAWSAMPALTVFKGVQLIVFLVLVVDAIGSFASTQEMIRFQVLYSVLNVILWQFTLLREGISLSSLHTSDVPGTVVAAVFLGALLRGKIWRSLHAFLLVAVALSTSTGCFFACVGGVIVMLLLMRGRAAGLGMLLIGLSILVAVTLPDYVNGVFFFGKNEGQIASGTGRLPIWQWVLQERVVTCPILGFGFGEGEVQARLYNIGGFRMMHMHNAFMSAIVNLGLCGVALWAVLWAAMIRTAWNVKNDRARIVLMGAAVGVFLNTISVESITAPLSMPWLAHTMFFTLLTVGQWPTVRRAVPRLRAARRLMSRSQPAAN